MKLEKAQCGNCGKMLDNTHLYVCIVIERDPAETKPQFYQWHIKANLHIWPAHSAIHLPAKPGEQI